MRPSPSQRKPLSPAEIPQSAILQSHDVLIQRHQHPVVHHSNAPRPRQALREAAELPGAAARQLAIHQGAAPGAIAAHGAVGTAQHATGTEPSEDNEESILTPGIFGLSHVATIVHKTLNKVALYPSKYEFYNKRK